MASSTNGRAEPGPEIAVVGMAARYPGARDLRQFWENVLARRQQFRRFPDERLPVSDYYDPAPRAPEKTYVTRAAYTDGFEFDWVARRIPQRTFESTDIAQWLALEVALAALEDAGYTPETVPTQRSAALVGNSLTGEQTRSNYLRLRWPYVRRALRASAAARRLPDRLVAELEETMEEYYKSVFPPVTEDTLAGALSNTIAGRICNFLDFKGGGYVTDGACASGMLAVATAATALTNNDIDFALAGAVDVSLDAAELIGFAKVGALTRDDMNVYDKRGSGFLLGEGCGFVALKRLEDARADGDYVYAVIRGWGIASDGKGAITAPRVDSQAEMLRRAYHRAGYSMQEVLFIEGHGTGTVVGDRVELEAIQLALTDDGDPNPRSVGVTSFKSLVGHTKAASGIAGLIKAVMAVNRRVLPPFAGCKEPNPIFIKGAHALYPILQGEVRNRDERIRAGASAMGFGGINAHIAIESADPPAAALEPAIEERAAMASGQETEVFVFGAASVPDLLKRSRELLEEAASMSIAELTDLAAHLAGDVAADWTVRAAVVAGKPDDLVERLGVVETRLTETPPGAGETFVSPGREVSIGHAVSPHRVGFLFPGQGSQQLGMARVLVERHAWARELVERTDGWLRDVGSQPVSDLIFRATERGLGRAEADEWTRALGETDVAQPAICLASLLWLRYLSLLGIGPVAVAGHSLGELTAFHAAGAFDEETLIKLAAVRGRAMAAPADGAGTMASLACSREMAEQLVAQVDGYVTVANINGPAQSVISGERPSVDAVVELAEAEGIRSVSLSVSNAFHSRLVADAAEHLRAHAPVSGALAETSVPVFSSVDGERVMPGRDLREHFANQVVSQVDFVSLMGELAQSCDLFVEVGPGRVLSGLVGAITGADGLPCLPVASEPSRDRDLNTVLATLFVGGAEINWPALYANRLVRPFVPPSELVFIENPVERPFRVTTEPSPTAVALEGNGGWIEALAQRADMPKNAIAEYLARRTDFVAGVIRTDIATSLRHDSGLVHEAVSAEPEATGDGAEPRTADAIAARLRALVGEQTGFPPETIPLDARLLDDLNLDSIKVAEFVSSAAQEFGVVEELDPSQFASATIQDVADALRAALPDAVTSPDAPVRSEGDVLLSLLAEQTGFPAETLSLDLRLLDDLNLDSIKAAELVAEAASRLGVPSDSLDPGGLANATLGEVAEALRHASAGAATAGRAAPAAARVRRVDEAFAERRSWVRNFVVEWLPEEAEAVAPLQVADANVLVLSDLGEASLAETIAGRFRNGGANVELASFPDVGEDILAGGPFAYVVAVLPRDSELVDEPELSLGRTVERLRAVATPPASPPGMPTTIAYVQFEGEPDGGAGAFTAGVHHERPDLRMRVIDVPTDVEAEALTERLFDELRTPDAYSFVRCDSELTRHVRRTRVQEPAVEYEPRRISWSEDDVILVTGGAKGITAECALAFARSTGPRMALVGSSPAPTGADSGEKDGSEEILSTLERFRAAGLTARYYQCDITDGEAVDAVVAQVRRDLGEITGVIHGAGVNHPRRVEQVPVEAARREVAPKVMGAIHLSRALADRPPKLFVGLASIIGVTGMPGNAWYGFANEALDMILRRFRAAHPETHAISIAFSVWGEVGMSTKLGSADRLAEMGVAAIPTEEGVARFVQLVENDPGADQVIVAARLRGLDTWYPSPRPLPAARRYLEDVLHLEPGVEVVARSQLTLERDAYLRDHVYEGSHLFPMVFGLEAMAQAVAHATGQPELLPLRIEDVVLERPIVVDPSRGAEIEVRVEVLEQEREDGLRRHVRAEIGTAQTGFAKAHFSATFVLGIEPEAPEERLDLPAAPLDLDPADDLYGWLLFQGPQFQRLRQIYLLDSERCLFRADARSYAEGTDGVGPFVLGDPFFRDALLQSGQLVVPKDICLPVRIERIGLSAATGAGGSRIGLAYDKVMEDGSIVARVVAYDEQGNLVERLDGYRSRILHHREDNPTAEEIAEPAKRDAELLPRELLRRAAALGVTSPEVSFAYLGDLHSLSREERRERELPLTQETIRRFIDANGGREG